MKRCDTCKELYPEADLIKTTMIFENPMFPVPLKQKEYSCGKCLDSAAHTVRTTYECYKTLGLIK